MRYNIEFSSAAASTQRHMEFETAPSDQNGLQGDYCNDLLGLRRFQLSLYGSCIVDAIV